MLTPPPFKLLLLALALLILGFFPASAKRPRRQRVVTKTGLHVLNPDTDTSISRKGYRTSTGWETTLRVQTVGKNTGWETSLSSEKWQTRTDDLGSQTDGPNTGWETSLSREKWQTRTDDLGSRTDGPSTGWETSLSRKKYHPKTDGESSPTTDGSSTGWETSLSQKKSHPKTDGGSSPTTDGSSTGWETSLSKKKYHAKTDSPASETNSPSTGWETSLSKKSHPKTNSESSLSKKKYHPKTDAESTSPTSQTDTPWETSLSHKKNHLQTVSESTSANNHNRPTSASDFLSTSSPVPTDRFETSESCSPNAETKVKGKATDAIPTDAYITDLPSSSSKVRVVTTTKVPSVPAETTGDASEGTIVGPLPTDTEAPVEKVDFESLPLKESASIKLPQLYANLDWNAKGGGGFRVVDLEKLGRGERQFGEEWEGRRFLEALGGEGTIEAEKEIRLVGMNVTCLVMLSDRSCRLVITGHPTKSAAPKPDAGTSNALCPHKDQPCMVINMASKQDEDEVNLPTNGPLVEIKNGFANVRFGSKFRGLKGIKIQSYKLLEDSALGAGEVESQGFAVAGMEINRGGEGSGGLEVGGQVVVGKGEEEL